MTAEKPSDSAEISFSSFVSFRCQKNNEKEAKGRQNKCAEICKEKAAKRKLQRCEFMRI